MILKKPYGILIKHFRLIHIILTVLTIYIAIRTRVIVNFFADYVANNYSVTIIDNMVSSYISPFIYVFIIIVLLMLIAMFVLLRYKKKPNKAYLFTIIYYVLLLVMIFIAAYLITSLSDGFWETAAARQYRDFAQLIYWPQFIFIIILGIRSLGFNIKKFNFKSDLKEMELSEKDSELVEINIDFDTSKAKRLIRRLLREFFYYFKENKFIFICILSVLVIVLGYFIFSSVEKLNYKYKQGDTFVYNGFRYNIDDSVITNLKYNGDVISNDTYYLLVKFTVKNIGREDAPLDYENFKVYIGKNYYYPVLDLGTYFKDYAKPYLGEKIKTDETKTYTFAYAIEKKYRNRDFQITVFNGISLKKKEFTPKTMTIKLNPVLIDNVTLVSSNVLYNELSFSGTYLNNTKLKVKDFYVGQKYNYTYENCYKDDCRTYNDFVTADYSLQNKRTLLVLDCDFSLDETSAYYLGARSVSNFAADFFKVQYVINGTTKTTQVNVVTPTNIVGKTVLQVNSEIEQASKIDLVITIRNRSYIINLKNE